jgi:hypothetical protein
MDTVEDIRESGGTGKPGETTVEVDGGASDGGESEAKVITSSEVARLLRGSFGETSGEAEGNEVQPEGETGATETPAGEETPTGELPQGLQAELEAWESKGGGTLPTSLQALVDKRIGKLTGEREEHKAAREKAETKVAELEQKLQQQPASSGPVKGGISTEKELDEAERNGRGFVNDVENYLDESATEEERGRVERHMERTGKDLKALKREAREINQFLASSLPAERQALKEFRAVESQSRAMAEKLFPFLKDKASSQYAFTREVLDLFPDLDRRTPGHLMALGTWALGRQAVEKMLTEQAKGNGGGARPGISRVPPKSPAGGGAAPPARRTAPQEAEEAAARQQFEAKPNRETVAELLKLGLR